MKKLIALLSPVIFTATLYAQSNDNSYRLRAAEVANEVWRENDDAFNLTTVPATMSQESAVIIASSIDIKNAASTKSRLNRIPKFTYQTTVHYRIKLQDKPALEAYSSLEYTKQLNQNFYYGFSRLFNKKDGYIGVKIIKSNGAESTVNTGEEVLTSDEAKYKEGKLAIPGLEVGDILDYYIRTETVQEGFAALQGPYTFFMEREYPTLFYHLRLQLDFAAGVKYINGNGAPPLQRSHNDNEDIILELTTTNVPRMVSSTWASNLRQSPYIRLEYKMVPDGPYLYSDFRRGEVRQGFSVDNIINEYKSAMRSFTNDYSLAPIKLAKTYFGNEVLYNVNHDSLVKVLYDANRYNTFFVFLRDNIEISHDLNYRYARSIYSAINFSKMLDQHGITNAVYFVCSRYSVNWKDALNLNDFSALIKVNTGKEYWLSFDDMMTQFKEIPGKFQGEEALLIAADGSGKYVASVDRVPLSTTAANTDLETMTVKIDTTDWESLLVDRNCKQTGELRHSAQKKLILIDDMESHFASMFSQAKLEQRISADKKTEKMANQFSVFLKEEHEGLERYFADDQQNHFDVTSAKINGYRIVEPAVLHEKKPFEYHTNFSLSGYLKKAGDNYVFEAGRLIGAIRKMTGQERTRTVDIYRLCPATYSWNITVYKPAGYSLKGVNEMNHSLTNETGKFNAVVTEDSSSVNLRVSITYQNNYEKAGNWSKLLELTDALYDFSMQKLLLEKQ